MISPRITVVCRSDFFRLHRYCNVQKSLLHTVCFFRINSTDRHGILLEEVYKITWHAHGWCVGQTTPNKIWRSLFRICRLPLELEVIMTFHLTTVTVTREGCHLNVKKAKKAIFFMIFSISWSNQMSYIFGLKGHRRRPSRLMVPSGVNKSLTSQVWEKIFRLLFFRVKIKREVPEVPNSFI